MICTLILSLALTAATAVADCHDYVLISTRGTYEAQGPSVGYAGMISRTFAELPNGIEYDTVYPASDNLGASVPVGVNDIATYIKSGVEACPEQKYALLGYSQGASVTDFALNEFKDPASAAYKLIKAIVVIGNPGHVPGSDANVDQDGGDSTKDLPGSYYAGGGGAIAQSYYDDDKVLDICYTGDVVCALPPNGTFAILPAHLAYGGDTGVQQQGGAFLIHKLSYECE